MNSQLPISPLSTQSAIACITEPLPITLESLGEISVTTLIEESKESNSAEASVSVSNHYSPGMSSGIEERALSLLGAGVNAESVANALGVTPSRIAQLLSGKMFSDKVAQLRYENLQKHNIRDNKYDSLEDKLINKLEKSLPLMVRPDTILKAISTINGAKRRGHNAPDTTANRTDIVSLVLPSIIAKKFTVNIDINNQVTKAGEQELITMQSGNLLKQVEAAIEKRVLEHTSSIETTEPTKPTEPSTRSVEKEASSDILQSEGS